MGGGTRREDPAGYDPMRDDPVCNPMDNFGSESLKREEEGTFRILAKDSPLNHKLSTLNGSEVGEVVDIMMKSETGGDCCRAIGAPPYVPRKTSNSSVEEVPISVMAKFVFDQDEELIGRDQHYEGYIIVSNELLNMYNLHFDQIQIHSVNTTTPDNIYAVVESAYLEFTSVRGLGRFLQNNFAQVKHLTLLFYEYEEFEFEWDMVADLVELESLSVRVVVQSGRYAPLRGLKKIPNFVFSSEDGVVKKKTKLRYVSIDIPYADISEWKIDQNMNLISVNITAAIAPIPQGKEDYENSPWKDMPLRILNLRVWWCTEYSNMVDMGIKSEFQSQPSGTSFYVQALCSGIEKYGTSPFNFGSISYFSFDAGNCGVPALISKECGGLLFKSVESLESLNLDGFTVNDSLVNAIGQSSKLYWVHLLNVEWAYFGKSFHIAAGESVNISMVKVPSHSNLQLIEKEGPIILDLSLLCVFPCHLSIDGGGYAIKHPSYVTIIGNMDLYRTRQLSGKEPDFSVMLNNVKIQDSGSDLLMSRILREQSAFSAKHVDVKAVVKMFSCLAERAGRRPCVGSTYQKLSSIEVIGSDRTVICNKSDLHINLQWLKTIPLLDDLRLENVCVTGFENLSFHGSLHLVNNGLKQDIPTSFAHDLYEVGLCYNGIRNGVQYLTRFWGPVFNVSGNNISEFDLKGFVLGGGENFAFADTRKWFGVRDLDISRNILDHFEMEVYNVMLMLYTGKTYSTINVSNNKLKSILLRSDLPPVYAQGYRNLSLEYEHCGYDTIGKRTAEHVTLSVDISRNELTVLETLSLTNLRTLQFLNASRNNIKRIERNFVSGVTCYNKNGCYMDLSHNRLGLDQNLSLHDITQHSCISHLDLSYNGIESVPKGLGSLIQKCLRVYTDYKNSFALPGSDSETNRFGKRFYIIVNLKYNNITKFDRSFCDGLDEAYLNTVFGEKPRTKMFMYVDLSHNNLFHISEAALNCKSAFLLLNINHNPIAGLPNLTAHVNYPLVLLSAANTAIKNIPHSFNNPDTLFSLKSIYISGKMNWACCELLQLSPMTNSTTPLLRINPDNFENVDLIMLMEANSNAPSSSKLSISSMECSYRRENQYLSFEEFKNYKWGLNREVCAHIDIDSGDNTLMLFGSVVSSLCIVYVIVIVILMFALSKSKPRDLLTDYDHCIWIASVSDLDGRAVYAIEPQPKSNYSPNCPSDAETKAIKFFRSEEDNVYSHQAISIYEHYLADTLNHLGSEDGYDSVTYVIVYTLVHFSRAI
eukprot:Nk52_evm26s32 gene=Nk52_evmTU26s32